MHPQPEAYPNGAAAPLQKTSQIFPPSQIYEHVSVLNPTVLELIRFQFAPKVLEIFGERVPTI